MLVSENESTRFWATVYNGPKGPNVEDIFFVYVDNTTGFDASTHATFLQAEIQNCIIHELRNFSKHLSYEVLEPFMTDCKAVYTVVG